MKKVIFTICLLINALKSFAFNPSNARVAKEDWSPLPTPIIIVSLIILIVISLCMGLSKDKDGKYDTLSMLWISILGIISLILVLWNL